MGLQYDSLDQETRGLMVEEITLDQESNSLYSSSYLTDEAAIRWPDMLLSAARIGTDETLAEELRSTRSFRQTYTRKKPKGGFTQARVPSTAHRTLAEGQFNTYYIRALCRRCDPESQALEIYRARGSDVPRAESERMIGAFLDPETTLEALRATSEAGFSDSIPQPNSGLSVRLISN